MHPSCMYACMRDAVCVCVRAGIACMCADIHDVSSRFVCVRVHGRYACMCMNACMQEIAAKPTDSATHDDELLLLELDDDDELLLRLLDELDDDDELLLLDLRMEHAVCTGAYFAGCAAWLSYACMHTSKHACVYLCGCVFMHACMPVFVHGLRYVTHNSRHVCVYACLYACFPCMFFMHAFRVLDACVCM